jgi:hypothetical protein
VLKIAAAVMAFLCIAWWSNLASAQILARGNVYAGVSYGQLTDTVIQQAYRGWNGSVEDLPFSHLPYLGLTLDASGFYRSGVTQYNLFVGPRISKNYDAWRPFLQGMAGVRHISSAGLIYNPITIDIGGGVDYKLSFRNFSWRVQGDFMRSHYASAYQNDFRASTGIVWRF